MPTPSRGLAAFCLIALLAACGEESGGGVSANASPEPNPANAQNKAPAAPVIDLEALKEKGYAIGDVVLGDPKAPVTVIEYASLTCPACQAFHTNSLPALKRDYINTGKVKLIVRDVLGRGRSGLYALALARCSGADLYYPYLDELFRRQDGFRTQDEGANLLELRRIGKLAGLSRPQFDACLGDNLYLNALYQQHQKNVGVLIENEAGTPFFIIQPGDKQKLIKGTVDAQTMAAAIDGFLK